MVLDLSPSRTERSALLDGEADIKQLPLWAALRKRCYRSMGHTLVTPPNSFSTLSKRRSLCVYLQGEVLLHNSIELLNSICALIYGLVGESVWKVSLITQRVAFELFLPFTFFSVSGHIISHANFKEAPPCFPKLNNWRKCSYNFKMTCNLCLSDTIHLKQHRKWLLTGVHVDGFVLEVWRYRLFLTTVEWSSRAYEVLKRQNSSYSPSKKQFLLLDCWPSVISADFSIFGKRHCEERRSCIQSMHF